MMDGWMDDCVDIQDNKNFLQKSLYFVGIYKTCLCLLIYVWSKIVNKKLMGIKMNYERYMTFQIFGSKIRSVSTRTNRNFETHTRTHQRDIKLLECIFFGSRAGLNTKQSVF